jgi:hypothetical protein
VAISASSIFPSASADHCEIDDGAGTSPSLASKRARRAATRGRIEAWLHAARNTWSALRSRSPELLEIDGLAGDGPAQVRDGDDSVEV